MKYIGIIGENSIEYVEKILEIWNAGDCAVLIDCKTPYKSAVKLLEVSNCNKCYIDNTLNSNYYERDECNIVFEKFKNSAKINQFLPSSFYEKFVEKYSIKPAIVIYSSGTTGNLKGIVLSHYSINKNADMILKNMNINLNDMMYIVKKISHSSVLIGELLVALKCRIKIKNWYFCKSNNDSLL